MRSADQQLLLRRRPARRPNNIVIEFNTSFSQGCNAQRRYFFEKARSVRKIILRKEYTWLQAAVLLIAAVAFIAFKAVSGPHPAIAGNEQVYVSRVVDGDTLKLSNRERVRLIGVDTPELHYSDKLVRDARKTGRDVKTIQALGAKASAFTKALCEGKKVRLEFDVEKHDRYGRLLAYVYLEDGTFVNAKIIEEGYAQVMTIPPNVKYADRFLELQRKARESRKGLWGIE